MLLDEFIEKLVFMRSLQVPFLFKALLQLQVESTQSREYVYLLAHLPLELAPKALFKFLPSEEGTVASTSASLVGQ